MTLGETEEPFLTWSMTQTSRKKKFNDDLLANPGDLQLAEITYPDLVHVLNHSELVEAFNIYDEPANNAKRRARRMGLLAILLASLALLGAAAEPIYPDSDERFQRILAVGAATCGIVSVMIALWGFLFLKRKERWLLGRLMTERLRQFHFQTFVCRVPEVIDSLDPQDPKAKTTYDLLRTKWFSHFKSQHVGNEVSILTTMIDDEAHAEMWLHDQPSAKNVDYRKLPPSYFDAYRELRIVHQLFYANWQLRFGGSLLSTPRRQVKLITHGSLYSILLLFGFHGLLVASVSFDLVLNHWLPVLALWSAIFTLSFRALDEGLRPRHEVNRYRDYRSALEGIRNRFDEESDPARKIGIMIEMERLSFEEMKSFLRNASAVTFVM